jgi:ketosteroid isomerase-like protein
MRQFLVGTFVLAGVIASAHATAQAPSASSGALSDLLKRQTEEFARASQSRDKAVLGKYLDTAVVFTNETGATGTREDLLSGPAGPHGPLPKNEIVDWMLREQGDVATATFTDVVTTDYFGRVVENRYRSTEVWAHRADGWKMIASDTAYVPRDPPPMQVSATEMDEYVGVYQFAPGLKVAITRTGDGLAASTNGAPAVPMAFEVHDVAFSVGGGTARRLFLRGPTGRVVGYVSSRNGTDLHFDRVA